MSRSISDFLASADRSRLHRSACQNCCRRKECPYSCDRAFENSLRRAAAQGEAAARLLTAEAERLLEETSRADRVCCLLRADEATERVLAGILYAENALLESLSAL